MTSSFQTSTLSPTASMANLILPLASCQKCSAITCGFEGVVQRTIFGDFRMRNNLRTRRAKERPTHKEIGTISATGEYSVTSVPVGEFPAPYFVYSFGQSGLLAGFPQDTDMSSCFWSMRTIHSIPETDAFKEQYNWDGRYTHKFEPYPFMRTLAKIGYSFAVALLGLSSFRRLVVSAMMRKEENISHFVGMNEHWPQSDAEQLHHLQFRFQKGPFLQTLIVVEVRLFACTGTPVYHVVVGEFESDSQKDLAMEKILKRSDVKTFSGRA